MRVVGSLGNTTILVNTTEATGEIHHSMDPYPNHVVRSGSNWTESCVTMVTTVYQCVLFIRESVGEDHFFLFCFSDIWVYYYNSGSCFMILDGLIYTVVIYDDVRVFINI